MRMTYAGSGYPLTLLMHVHLFLIYVLHRPICFAELKMPMGQRQLAKLLHTNQNPLWTSISTIIACGCITPPCFLIFTFFQSPENHSQGISSFAFRLICLSCQSSWFRDALSELDPSYDKLTFISNPPDVVDESTTARQRRRNAAKPILRIKAGGNFGSTEVCRLIQYDRLSKFIPWQMDYPNDRDVLETFECTRSISFRYVPSICLLPIFHSPT
jgi:hypothetical protein